MLIKYKTEPTIIVLSPNSANLIKILTQFVYSINIRYFSPPPLPCPVTLQGITYKIGAEAKGKYISPSSSVFCAAKYRGGVRRTEGLKKTATVTIPDSAFIGRRSRKGDETEGKGRGMFERSEFRRPRRRP